MFAILITEENLPKIIQERRSLTLEDLVFLQTCIGKDRYFVTGYVDQQGRVYEHSWMFLPESVLKNYEYDPQKIQTDWDQIVRKQPAPI